MLYGVLQNCNCVLWGFITMDFLMKLQRKLFTFVLTLYLFPRIRIFWPLKHRVRGGGLPVTKLQCQWRLEMKRGGHLEVTHFVCACNKCPSGLVNLFGSPACCLWSSHQSSLSIPLTTGVHFSMLRIIKNSENLYCDNTKVNMQMGG